MIQVPPGSHNLASDYESVFIQNLPFMPHLVLGGHTFFEYLKLLMLSYVCSMLNISGKMNSPVALLYFI